MRHTQLQHITNYITLQIGHISRTIFVGQIFIKYFTRLAFFEVNLYSCKEFLTTQLVNVPTLSVI